MLVSPGASPSDLPASRDRARASDTYSLRRTASTWPPSGAQAAAATAGSQAGSAGCRPNAPTVTTAKRS